MKHLTVVATTKASLGPDVLPEVRSWPFYRLYVKIDGPKVPETFPRVLTSDTIAQTIIQIDRDKNIAMAAYADGFSAMEWFKMPEDVRLARAKDILVHHGYDASIRIVDAIDIFWMEGIHYVSSLVKEFAAKVTSIQGNLVFAGEMTAMLNQGWVEGALESAERAAELVISGPFRK
jgi:monoamine oxidase